MTFTTTNWGTAQTVTVEAGQDNDGANDTATLTHTASGGDYFDVTKDLPVSITDDDTADIVLSETDLTVTEGDAAGTSYTVKLATRPSAGVSVSITGHLGTDLRLDKTTLTFTTGNWDAAQTVTVTAGEDDDGVVDPVAALTHTASGGDYFDVTKDLPVSITDDDTLAIVLSKTDLSLTEGDAAGMSYTVALATKPSSGVSVSITGHSGTDLRLDKTPLTFTTGNWNTAQTVTVTAGEDDDGVVDPVATLTHTASGGDYANLTKDLTVTVTENDTPDIVISRDSLTVVEGDAAGMSYTVALATRPSETVTVTISGHDGADLTLSGTGLTNNQLTFTVDNWDAAQTVTVEAGQDNDGANDTATLTHTASGGDYAGITIDLPVTVTDDDAPAVVLSKTDLSLTEGDAAGMSYTVALATRPSAGVSVSITGHSGTDLRLDKTTLTFTVDNWDAAQTVTVTAAEDNDGVVDPVATLTHTASGGDYANLTRDLTVTVTENDTPDIVISRDSLTVVEGDAAGMSYTVALATKPSAGVSVSITGHSGTDLRLDKTTLTFTVDNWDAAQTVTVTAGEDDDGVVDPVATLTHTASGGDYFNVTKDLPVSITDDDTPAIVLSETDLTVTEGDAAGSTYTVALATKPSDTVTVTISGHDGTDLTLSGTTLTSNQLTFTTTNWGTAQTVTVKAADDDNADNESETLTHTASGGDYVNVAKDLPVSITDDAPAGVSVSFGQGGLQGDRGSRGVRHRQPERGPGADGGDPAGGHQPGRGQRLGPTAAFRRG